MKKKIFTILSVLCCLFAVTKVLGQTSGLVISGKVSSGSDKETLLGVGLKLKGTTTDTSTDVNGKYSIKLHSDI